MAKKNLKVKIPVQTEIKDNADKKKDVNNSFLSKNIISNKISWGSKI